MGCAKSFLISVVSILYAISLSAQTAVSDTLDLRILVERTTESGSLLQQDSLVHINELLQLLKEYDTETVNVHIKLEGYPQPKYVVCDSVSEKVSDTVYVTKVVHKKREWKDLVSQTPVFAVRTNALAIPLLNAGIEVPIGKHWSVGADYYYPWIWRGKNYESCNQMLGFDVEGRYWFANDKLPDESRLLGHSVGVYVGAGYYDFEREWKGHQGEYLNAGVDYLYAMPLFGGRIHLEFEIGMGYIYSKAVPYTFIGDECYLDKNIIRNIHWVGPTKAQVSVVMPVYISKEQWDTFCIKVDDAFDEMFDGEVIGKIGSWFKRKNK